MNEASFDEIADQIYAAVTRQVPAYRRPTDTAFDLDFRASNRLTAAMLWTSLLQDTPPARSDLDQLATLARNRVHQGISITSILQSYRIGAQIVLSRALATLPPTQHATVAKKVLEATEQVSTLVTVAYMDELHRTSQSLRQRQTDAVVRLMYSSDFSDLETGGDIRLLGLEPESTLFVVVVGGRPDSLVSASDSARDIWTLQARFESMSPKGITAIVNRRLVWIVPLPRAEVPGDWPHTVLVAALPSSLICGVGGPTVATDVAELQKAVREAERAYELGPLLSSSASVFTYSDVAVLDLFREGPEIDRFIELTLKPLLRLRAERRRALLSCLSALLATGLNQKAAAYRLGVHENTVAKRLRVAEELLGSKVDAGYPGLRILLAMWLYDTKTPDTGA